MFIIGWAIRLSSIHATFNHYLIFLAYTAEKRLSYEMQGLMRCLLRKCIVFILKCILALHRAVNTSIIV